MAGFRKAKAEQASLKVAVYGTAGSGKTFTSLLWAEGLAKLTGKRIAVVDTEHGTDFYAQAIPDRETHPEAFDFDALYSRSLTEIVEAVTSLDTKTYSIVVIDSWTHFWEAAINAYSGRTTKIGTIPFHAWQSIKKPYKRLVSWLLSQPLHVFMVGRQGNEYADDADTGETKMVGVKMKAEGETAYEPHILVRMELERGKTRHDLATISAFIEKDRSGVIAGKTIAWPNFDNVIKPLMPLLGSTQAKMSDTETVAATDAENLSDQADAKTAKSAKTLRTFKAEIDLCDDQAALAAIGKKITAAIKKEMLTSDVNALREHYKTAEANLRKVVP